MRSTSAGIHDEAGKAAVAAVARSKQERLKCTWSIFWMAKAGALRPTCTSSNSPIDRGLSTFWPSRGNSSDKLEKMGTPEIDPRMGTIDLMLCLARFLAAFEGAKRPQETGRGPTVGDAA